MNVIYLLKTFGLGKINLKVVGKYRVVLLEYNRLIRKIVFFYRF